LGFSYDTGLYLQFRATDRDDFQLAYAASLSESSDYAGADRLVGELIDRRPGWLQARWLRVAICYRTQRWSDVVRLLTPVVNDSSLDEMYAHAARVRRPPGRRPGRRPRKSGVVCGMRRGTSPPTVSRSTTGFRTPSPRSGRCHHRKRGPRWRSPEPQPIPASQWYARSDPTTGPVRSRLSPG
jgi:hypothetical protein